MYLRESLSLLLIECKPWATGKPRGPYEDFDGWPVVVRNRHQPGPGGTGHLRYPGLSRVRTGQPVGPWTKGEGLGRCSSGQAPGTRRAASAPVGVPSSRGRCGRQPAPHTGRHEHDSAARPWTTTRVDTTPESIPATDRVTVWCQCPLDEPGRLYPLFTLCWCLSGKRTGWGATATPDTQGEGLGDVRRTRGGWLMTGGTTSRDGSRGASTTVGVARRPSSVPPWGPRPEQPPGWGVAPAGRGVGASKRVSVWCHWQCGEKCPFTLPLP